MRKGSQSRRRQARADRRRAAARDRTPRPVLLGEYVVLVLIVAVPIAVNTKSRDYADVKSVVLGLGAAAGLAAWLLVSWRRGRLAWVRSPLTTAVLAFTLWAAASIAYASHRVVVISEFGRLASCVGLFLLALTALRRADQVRRVIAAACVAAVPVCVYAFMQMAGVDPMPWSVPTTRAASFFGNATFLASFLVLVMPLAVAAGWPTAGEGSGRRARWVLFLGSAVMMAVCLGLTVSLGAVLGLGAGMLVSLGLSLAYAKREGTLRFGRTAALGAAALAVVAAGGYAAYRQMPVSQQRRVQQVVRGVDPYASERRLHWQVALDLFRERPLVGSGYGSYRVNSLPLMSQEWYRRFPGREERMLLPGYAHNEFLQVLADDGIIGGLAFVWVLGAFYVLAVRVCLRERDAFWRRAALGLVAAVTAFVFQNLFAITFRQAGTAMFFWLWLAVAAVAAARLGVPEEAEGGLRLREIRRRPASLAAAGVGGAALLAALVALGWVAVRPLLASRYLLQAQSAAMQGYLEDSGRLAERSLSYNPYSGVGYLTAAYAASRLGDEEKAAALNEKALRLLPGNGSVHYNLGVNYRMLGRLDKAVEHFGRAAKLVPTVGRNRAALAEALLAQGKLKEAERQAREALRLEPASAAHRMTLASILLQEKRPAEALLHLREAEKLDPENATVQRDLARVLLTEERYREASAAYERVVSVAPDVAEAHNALGICWFHLEEYEKAKSSFRRAVELAPAYQTAALNLAQSYGITGDRAAEREWLERAVRIAPDTKEGKKAQETLRSMGVAPPPT